MLVLRHRRPVRRPVRVVPVVVRWLLRGPGQRIRAGRAIVMMTGRRWWWSTVHMTAAAVGHSRGRGWPVQRPRFGVMVTAATAIVRCQLCGKRYGGRVAQRCGRLFFVTIILIERVVRVRSAAAISGIVLPRGIKTVVFLRKIKIKSTLLICSRNLLLRILYI